MAEHVYRFTAGARGLAARAVAPLGPRRPRRLLRLRARGDRPQARDRGRLHPRAARTAWPSCWPAATSTTSSARSTSSATARSTTTVRHLVGGELAREGVADVLRVARRRPRRAGCSTSSPTPTSSSTGARPSARGPAATCATTTRSRWRGSPSRASPSRSPPPGCASRSASSTRRARSWRWCSTPATRSRSPATPTRPRTSAATTTRRSSCSTDLGVTRAGGLRAPRAAAGADRMTATTGIGWDSHRLVAGRPLILGGVAIEHDRGLDGHSDADVLTHAIIDALLGAAAHGRHRPALPRHRRALPRRRLDAAAAHGRRDARRARAGRDPRRRHRRHGAPQARAPPRRDPRRAGRRRSAWRPSRSTSRPRPARAWASSAAARASRRWRWRPCTTGEPRDRAGPPRPRPARGAGRRLGPAHRRLPLAGPVPDPARDRRRGAGLRPRHPRRASSTPTSC